MQKSVAHLHFDVIASLAQWQSTGLVNQGSRIQISHEAVLLGLNVWLITFDANKVNLFACGTSLQPTVIQFRLQLERYGHGIQCFKMVLAVSKCFIKAGSHARRKRKRKEVHTSNANASTVQ